MQTEGMEGGMGLEGLEKREDLASKKCNIYARLLIDPDLAQAMEKLAHRHEERRSVLLDLQGKKPKKKESEKA